MCITTYVRVHILFISDKVEETKESGISKNTK